MPSFFFCRYFRQPRADRQSVDLRAGSCCISKDSYLIKYIHSTNLVELCTSFSALSSRPKTIADRRCCQRLASHQSHADGLTGWRFSISLYSHHIKFYRIGEQFVFLAHQVRKPCALFRLRFVFFRSISLIFIMIIVSMANDLGFGDDYSLVRPRPLP